MNSLIVSTAQEKFHGKKDADLKAQGYSKNDLLIIKHVKIPKNIIRNGKNG